MSLDRSGNVFPAVTLCAQGPCWLIYTRTYHSPDISLAWHISFVCSDRLMNVQQEQGWRREEGREGDALLPENHCLNVLFLAYVFLLFLLFTSSAFCVQELTWTQTECTVAWMAACATQTTLICYLGCQRKREGHVGNFPIGQEWECTLEKGAWGKYLASPLSSLISDHSCFWVSHSAVADGCRVTGRRRRWGQCCCLIYMPTAGVVRGQAHPGCLCENWNAVETGYISIRLILNPRYAASLVLHSSSRPVPFHLAAASSFSFRVVPLLLNAIPGRLVFVPEPIYVLAASVLEMFALVRSVPLVQPATEPGRSRPPANAFAVLWSLKQKAAPFCR